MVKKISSPEKNGVFKNRCLLTKRSLYIYTFSTIWPKNLFSDMSSAILQEYRAQITYLLYIYPLGQNGGQEFFGSSEECCSSWSGCCNSSCAGSCGDQQPLQQKLQDTPHQQPLSAAMVVMQVSSSYTVLVFVEFSVQFCSSTMRPKQFKISILIIIQT